MKYRVEVRNDGQDLWIDVWYYDHDGDNPWVLVESHYYEQGVRNT